MELKLESIHARQLNIRYSYDQYRFATSFWYEFEMKSLEEMYGPAFMEKVRGHAQQSSMFKFCSLKTHRSISDRILTWSLKNSSNFGG